MSPITNLNHHVRQTFKVTSKGVTVRELFQPLFLRLETKMSKGHFEQNRFLLSVFELVILLYPICSTVFPENVTLGTSLLPSYPLRSLRAFVPTSVASGGRRMGPVGWVRSVSSERRDQWGETVPKMEAPASVKTTSLGFRVSYKILIGGCSVRVWYQVQLGLASINR